MQAQAAGLWPSPPPPIYVENVFNTGIYSATGGSETFSILGSVNMYTKGGLVWIKARTDAVGHYLIRPVTGASSPWNQSNGTGADGSFGTTEFRVNSNNTVTMSNGNINSGGTNYASWNFAKQPKFFDIVTYTGNGSYPRTISHNLGSTPGCIIIKSASDAGYGWITWHRSLGANDALQLQTTGAKITDANLWNGTPTSTTFSVGSYSGCNANGVTYVAYLFAHDAGGFGLTGTDNVISCGSFTADVTNSATVSLGYEPQWILVKNASAVNSWAIVDTMRGLPADGSDRFLFANSSAAESGGGLVNINATGFYGNGTVTAFETYIYIAIRKGPMAVPTVGTTVFQPAYGTGGTPGYPSTFTVDALLNFFLAGSSGNPNLASRLSAPNYSVTSAAVAESNGGSIWKWDFQTGVGSSTFSSSFAGEMFRRAPSFFDVVCYTGTGSTTTITHNLGVTPELVITKSRSQALGWVVWTTSLASTDYWIRLDTTNAVITSPVGYGGTFSASNYTIANTGPFNALNNSGSTYIAYLFATCPGVSKVGTYTGTGALLTVNCGFAAGARFVLIKRTDSTGDWYVYDSARGISSGTDPYYLTNTDAAQVTGTNYVDTTAVGFQVTAAAPAGLNASGGTYIFLAIA
jgi:hypothetical protein